MQEIFLKDCTSDYPLAHQLEDSIEGFCWRKDQYGPLVTKITEAFMEYPYIGSMDVDESTCGFCGKQGICTEFYFQWNDTETLPMVEVKYKDETRVIHLPSLLTTGSKCREFPRVAEFVRENLNNVFSGISYDSPGKEGLLVLSTARLHRNLDRDSCMRKMLHLPINMVSTKERYELIDKLCTEYDYFIFAKRKTIPKDMSAVCDHSAMKGRIPKWYPRDAYKWEDEDIILGIPMSEIIRLERIL